MNLLERGSDARMNPTMTPRASSNSFSKSVFTVCNSCLCDACRADASRRSVRCISSLVCAKQETEESSLSLSLLFLSPMQSQVVSSSINVLSLPPRRTLAALFALLASLCRSLARSICSGDFFLRVFEDPVLLPPARETLSSSEPLLLLLEASGPDRSAST